MRRLCFVLVVATACSVRAETLAPRSLAALVLSETAALKPAPDLAGWQKSHPNERLKKADYDNEYESQGLWCAASAADFLLPGGVKGTRYAFFYIPLRTVADPLPERPDHGLIRQCRLLALWYEVKNLANPIEVADSTFAKLAASFGPAEEPPGFKRPDGDWGSGYWSPYKVWERKNGRVVVALDPGGPGPAPHPYPSRLLVIVRSSLAPRGLSSEWSFFEGPKGQPAFDGSSETASVAKLEKPCSFDDGSNNWEPGLIRLGEKLLRDFPESRWKPYIHLMLARAYAATLLLIYPSTDLNGATKPSASPDTLRREAIAHFRAFLEENPESPEASTAGKEAWRLLAGLPPSPIHFGCTD